MTQPSPAGDLPSDLVPPLQPGRPPPRSSPLVPGGVFRVDLTQAPQAINDLQEALRELKEIRNDARRLGSVDPTSRDSVSIDMARALGAVADGGPGSLSAAIESAMTQVQDLIDAMNADLAAYRNDDRHAGGRFDDLGRA